MLKTKWSRKLPSEPSSVSVIKDCANRYFLSFVVDVEPISKSILRESIGIDLGIRVFCASSINEKIYSPDYSKIERKISKVQKQLCRCLKGSERRNKVRLKLAKLHTKLADIRKDFLHKLSARLVSENRIVVLEDLAVSNMVKNRKLARAISRCGWSMFRTMCEAKAKQYLNREVRIISRWTPTSQVCSSCGFRWGKLDLSVREIKCIGCGESHDRDVNASQQILNVGVGHIHDRINKRTVRGHKTDSSAILGETSTRKLVIEQLRLF